MEDQQIVALYWERDGRAIRETAFYYGISESKVKSMLQRMRTALAEGLPNSNQVRKKFPPAVQKI